VRQACDVSRVTVCQVVTHTRVRHAVPHRTDVE
jgi:hypothetical protein